MAKAVVAALCDLGFDEGLVVARNDDAGPALAAAYGYDWVVDLPERAAPLLINVTPLGMDGADAGALAFPQGMIAASEIAFDVVAQPVETPFLKAARATGKTIISGAEVIVLQAVEQFVLYTGIRPSPDHIREAAAFAHGEAVAASLVD